MPASRGRAKFVPGNHRAHRSKDGMTPARRQRKFWRTQRDERLARIERDEQDDEIDELNANPGHHR